MYTTGGRHRYLPLGTQSSAARHRKWKKEKGFHDMGKDLPTNFCSTTFTYSVRADYYREHIRKKLSFKISIVLLGKFQFCDLPFFSREKAAALTAMSIEDDEEEVNRQGGGGGGEGGKVGRRELGKGFFFFTDA